MPTASIIETVFKKIYGMPCWGVSPGFGSFLTLNFGEPHLEVREPILAGKQASERVRKELTRRRIHARGDWHLWIKSCDWKVIAVGKSIGDSSNRLKILRAADFLDGQKLTRFMISTKKMETLFEFDLGATLRTRPYDGKSEQWLLFTPSHKVLTLRADGFFSYERANLSGPGKWKPILAAAL